MNGREIRLLVAVPMCSIGGIVLAHGYIHQEIAAFWIGLALVYAGAVCIGSVFGTDDPED